MSYPGRRAELSFGVVEKYFDDRDAMLLGCMTNPEAHDETSATGRDLGFRVDRPVAFGVADKRPIAALAIQSADVDEDISSRIPVLYYDYKRITPAGERSFFKAYVDNAERLNDPGTGRSKLADAGEMTVDAIINQTPKLDIREAYARQYLDNVHSALGNVAGGFGLFETVDDRLIGAFFAGEVALTRYVLQRDKAMRRTAELDLDANDLPDNWSDERAKKPMDYYAEAMSSLASLMPDAEMLIPIAQSSTLHSLEKRVGYRKIGPFAMRSLNKDLRVIRSKGLETYSLDSQPSPRSRALLDTIYRERTA